MAPTDLSLIPLILVFDNAEEGKTRPNLDILFWGAQNVNALE